MEHKVHQGRNVKRFREMLGIKQESLAFDLNISQQKISLLEQKEIIEKGMLEKIAGYMKIPVEAFQNFDEEAVINIIANTFHDGSIAHATAENIQCTFNPLDKMVELYERIILQQKEVIGRLEKLLQNGSDEHS